MDSLHISQLATSADSPAASDTMTSTSSSTSSPPTAVRADSASPPPVEAHETTVQPQESDSKAGEAVTSSAGPSSASEGGAVPTEEASSQVTTDHTGASEKGKGKEKARAEDRFNCCICLDLAEDPVVTPCGHLSCWPCCHEWLVTSKKRTCPVCKAPVTVERLIPIYSSEASGEKDPREKPLPPRPRPVPAPAPTTSFFGLPFQASTLSSSLSTSSFSFQAGGVFPFSGVSMSYTYPPTQSGVEGDAGAGFDTLRRGLVPGGEHEWLRQVFQQVFLVLFFAVFVMITFTG